MFRKIFLPILLVVLMISCDLADKKNNFVIDEDSLSNDAFSEDVLTENLFSDDDSFISKGIGQCLKQGEQQYGAVIADSGRDKDFSVLYGIITDRATGLLWEQQYYKLPARTGGNTCLGEWSVPTPHELASIVDYSLKNPAIYSIFNNTPSSRFLVSFNGIASGFWGIDFRNGSLNRDPYSNGITYLRCVNRDNVVPFYGIRYDEKINDDDKITIIDNLTKLEWTREYAKYPWLEAIEYCAGLNYGGNDDWRLPGINELRSLVDYSKSRPASNFSMKDGELSPGRFWTATVVAGNSGFAWYINFNEGYILNYGVATDPEYVLCVRSAAGLTEPIENEICYREKNDGQSRPDYANLPDYDSEVPDEDTVIIDPGEQPYATALADTGRDKDFNISDPAGNGQITVSDSVTGLIWQQAINTQPVSWKDSFNHCENLNYAGVWGWHLATPHEFASLVDYGRADPALYKSAFPGINSSTLWTALHGIGTFSSDVWIIDFSSGTLDTSYPVHSGYYLLCVRRDNVLPFNGDRFTQKEDADKNSTTIDNMTGLEWTTGEKQSEIWKNELMTRQEASDYCDSLEHRGSSDWRLPGINELRSIVFYSNNGTISGMLGIYLPVSLWSAAFFAGEEKNAWAISFPNGNIYSSAAIDKLNAICVRP